MNKVVLITGGSDGLGRSIAKDIVKNFTVVILSPSEDKLKKVSEEIGCEYVLGDVSNYESVVDAVSKIVKRYGRIDCLVNGAGLWIQDELDMNDPSLIRKVIEVNTLGTILMAKAVIPQMKKQKQGLIININSQSGLYPKEERSVYVASKFAITGFERSLQPELSKYGIAVTGVLPGGMKTDFFEKAGNTKDKSTFIDTKEVVEVIEFLLTRKQTTVITEVGIKNINN